MALITDTRWCARDTLGNPCVGATLTIYDAGTTNLSSVYRNNALSTPMTNPTSGSDVSDSAGYFPQVFATEGALFDITLKTSLGVVLKSYVSVPAIGTSSSAINRDFGTSRLQIRGSGGRVYFEGGDASGDDIGGKVTVGGYAGTQADDMVLDAAALATTGTLAAGGIITELGKSLPGSVQDSASFSGAAFVTIPLANSPATIRVWDIDLIDLTSSAGVALGATFSFDSGATFASANYVSMYMTQNNSADGFAAGSSAALMTLSPASSLTNSMGQLRIVTTASSGKTFLMGSLALEDASVRYACTATYNASAARATHLKLSVASGTLSGKYRVTPLRGL